MPEVVSYRFGGIYLISNNDIETTVLCRKCLSKVIHVKLNNDDCLYFNHKGHCTECNEYQDIVCGIKFRKRLFAKFDTARNSNLVKK